MHLINIHDLSLKTIETLFREADQFKKNPWQSAILNQKIIAQLFFENSSRTRYSFEIAAKRLGATVLNLDLQTSSTQKGETILDTIQNLEAMQIDAFIIRHQDNDICEYLASHLKTNAKIINAGMGTQSHPSQALLDAYSIKQHNANFTDLSVAIVGDIAHSRVAHSNIECLQKLGVKNIRLIGPEIFHPKNIPNVTIFTDLEKGITNADVIMMLRIQKERLNASELPELQDYIKQFQLTSERLKFAKKDALIMHPGPINRDVEMTTEVADSKQSIILQQVQNGVFMRQAILKLCLSLKP